MEILACTERKKCWTSDRRVLGSTFENFLFISLRKERKKLVKVIKVQKKEIKWILNLNTWVRKYFVITRSWVQWMLLGWVLGLMRRNFIMLEFNSGVWEWKKNNEKNEQKNIKSSLIIYSSEELKQNFLFSVFIKKIYFNLQ